MVSADAIETALDLLNEEAAIEEAMIEFAGEQAPFIQYLNTDGFDLLSDEEADYIQYLSLVIYAAVDEEADEDLRTLSGELIEQWDERAWEWMQDSVGKPMSSRLDVFFNKIDQEELLAFAEDSLVDPDEDEEEGAVLFDSGASRELGFVALAVLIGALDGIME